MPAPCQVADSLLQLIGNTPIVQLRNIPSPGSAEIWAKLESLNPGGSLKDRICLSMIEAAERSGELTPGMTIVEPTSGNTGIGLALIAAVKGYQLTLTMPDTMSEERQNLLAAYGADLILTPDTKGMHAAIQKAQQTAASHPRYFMPQQFDNPANPEIHRQTTAQEILQQLPHLDALVLGVGTGGTITGVGEVLRQKNIRISKSLPLSRLPRPFLQGKTQATTTFKGLVRVFVPSILDTEIYDEVLSVSDEEATTYTRDLARQEGILVGISSGAVCAASVRVAKNLGEGKERSHYFL